MRSRRVLQHENIKLVTEAGPRAPMSSASLYMECLEDTDLDRHRLLVVISGWTWPGGRGGRWGETVSA